MVYTMGLPPSSSMFISKPFLSAVAIMTMIGFVLCIPPLTACCWTSWPSRTSVVSAASGMKPERPAGLISTQVSTKWSLIAYGNL